MAHCPSCHQGSLQYDRLDGRLLCQTCNHCGGHWILLTDYLRWQAEAPLQPVDGAPATVEAEDSKQALICPVSGKLMLKYRISSNSSHRLDLSPAVNAVWLDPGEWQLLKQEGLAARLNSIFTDPWQRQIREQSARETFTVLYRRQFGEEAYQQLKTFREWLDTQEKRSEMLAYLIADNPYSVR